MARCDLPFGSLVYCVYKNVKYSQVSISPTSGQCLPMQTRKDGLPRRPFASFPAVQNAMGMAHFYGTTPNPLLTECVRIIWRRPSKIVNHFTS
jgi:hypothetical protein